METRMAGIGLQVPQRLSNRLQPLGEPLVSLKAREIGVRLRGEPERGHSSSASAYCAKRPRRTTFPSAESFSPCWTAFIAALFFHSQASEAGTSTCGSRMIRPLASLCALKLLTPLASAPRVIRPLL